jgi:tRNA threonylcarbamoyladenosine biosynthesis protein TsaE
MTTLTLVTESAHATRELGEVLGWALRPGEGNGASGGALVLLAGPLGAGKTTLVQGIGRALGVVEPITSPTFVLVREYDLAGGERLVHMDYYRLSGETEVLELGLADYLAGDDIVVVEWPDRAWRVLPDARLEVTLAHDDGRRRITLAALGDPARRALEAAGRWAGDR